MVFAPVAPPVMFSTAARASSSAPLEDSRVYTVPDKLAKLIGVTPVTAWSINAKLLLVVLPHRPAWSPGVISSRPSVSVYVDI